MVGVPYRGALVHRVRGNSRPDLLPADSLVFTFESRFEIGAICRWHQLLRLHGNRLFSEQPEREAAPGWRRTARQERRAAGSPGNAGKHPALHARWTDYDRSGWKNHADQPTRIELPETEVRRHSRRQGFIVIPGSTPSRRFISGSGRATRQHARRREDFWSNDHAADDARWRSDWLRLHLRRSHRSPQIAK